jgi:hypothetical protein
MERSVVTQQGQVFELKRRSREGQPLWAYRYRLSGRGSRRVQRGGLASEQDAAAALERDLERVRRQRRIPRSLTLAELIETYLAQHDVQRVTIEKLRWLLSKATALFDDRGRDGREHAIHLLDAFNAPEFEPWTLVDAAWTSKQRSAVSNSNRNGR